MTIEEIVTIVVGLAGTVLAWFLVRRRGKVASTVVEPPKPVTHATAAPVVEAAVDATHARHESAINKIEHAAETEAPASATADLLNDRTRRGDG